MHKIWNLPSMFLIKVNGLSTMTCSVLFLEEISLVFKSSFTVKLWYRIYSRKDVEVHKCVNVWGVEIETKLSVKLGIRRDILFTYWIVSCFVSFLKNETGRTNFYLFSLTLVIWFSKLFLCMCLSACVCRCMCTVCKATVMEASFIPVCHSPFVYWGMVCHWT